MRIKESAFAIALVGIVVIACSSSLRYPACERDDQCAVANKHDYCVAGTCVYCRTSIDCGERERCRAGKCENDPDLPIPRDGGADAADSGEEEEEDAEAAEPPPPSHVIPRGVRRFLHP